jgi:hypothetical protein
VDLAVTRSHDYHRFMASQPNQWEALQDQEAAQPPREYPPDESGQEKAKRPRRFDGVRTVGEFAGHVLRAILDGLP